MFRFALFLTTMWGAFLFWENAMAGICEKVVRVFYRPEMVAPSGSVLSQSSYKPKWFVDGLKKSGIPHLIWDRFRPLAPEEIALAHDPEYVDGIFTLSTENGFENRSLEIAKSLPFVLGSHFAAAQDALHGGKITCSPTAGFHHAGYSEGGGFCTFNGLITTSLMLMQEDGPSRIAIIDADYHPGNGTREIIERLGLGSHIFHYSFGEHFRFDPDDPTQADQYLQRARGLLSNLAKFQPQIILYQAGADAHIDDSFGGLLTTEQMRERDRIVFGHARNLNIPLVWNLAGGYQGSARNQLAPVVRLHLQTAEENLKAFEEP